MMVDDLVDGWVVMLAFEKVVMKVDSMVASWVDLLLL